MKRQGMSPAAAALPAGAAPPAAGGPLVSSCISQQNRFEVFASSLSVKRPGTGHQDAVPPDRSDTSINSFSRYSRMRLRKRAKDAVPSLISQFGLTYHDDWPSDGSVCKSHLNAWLTSLRRILPGVGYLWLLEFQKRNAPHYHVFLTVPPDESIRLQLAEAWCRITSPGDPSSLRFHQDQRNWISWDMGTGSYLCKYLDKEAQKFVPPGYVKFGRFWGNSRGLVQKLDEKTEEEVDEQCSVVDQQSGEVYGGSKVVIRWLGRLAEKQTNGYSRFRSRAPHSSYSILQGAAAFHQICRYFDKLNLQQKGNSS